MTVQTYGPKILPVLPASASEVKVTYANGVVPTFTTPVTVDPTTHAVSFALDDGGTPPVKLIIRVEKAGGGGSTTVRVTLPEQADAWAAQPPQLIEFPANASFEGTDPGVVPFLQASFVAKARTALIDVDVFARSIGFGTVSLWLAYCDAAMGRRPYPRTQPEFLAPPAGITYVGVGGLMPNMETPDLTTKPSGLATQASRKVRLTGLTVGHTYNVDLCYGIQGNGSTKLTVAGSLFRCAVVGTKTGTLKCYVGRFTAGGGVTVTTFPGVRPFTNPTQGATIAVGATERVNALAPTPDRTKVIYSHSVTDGSAGSVDILDTTTDTSLHNTALGADITNRIAPTPDSAAAWLLMASSNTVRLLTLATGALAAGVATVGYPIDGQVTPDGATLWVLGQTGKALRSHNAVTGAAVGADIAIPAVGATQPTPTAMCLSNDGTKAYVADSANGLLYEINLQTRQIVRSINIGVKTWNRVLVYPGTSTTTVQVFGSGGTVGASNYTIRQINVTDWTSYVDWIVNTNYNDAWLGPRGEIMALDATNGQITYWFGARFGIKNVFPGGSPDFVWGEHAQLLVGPST